MKCMICGGQTLPGAKLCLPCRAALRRARDDTISELLPLPRRREAFAFSHSPDIGRHTPLAPAARPVADRPAASVRARRLTSAQLHAAAVVAFVAAAGVLTFFMARELQRERAAAAPLAVAPATDQAASPRVSPSSMLGTARDESQATAASSPPVESETVDVVPATPPPAASKIDRPPRPRPPVAKAAVVLDPFPATESVAPPVIIAAPHPAPAPSRAAPPDRAQLLAASLARCGGDFFTRVGCEQRTRAQYCEGQWGQIPQCPAGIANEHGQ